jgi:hypothetical protein
VEQEGDEKNMSLLTTVKTNGDKVISKFNPGNIKMWFEEELAKTTNTQPSVKMNYSELGFEVAHKYVTGELLLTVGFAYLPHELPG